MTDTTLIVRDAPIGHISPRLYGHFAEHLGRCCYDGLWAGLEQSDVPHSSGFHSAALEALQALPVPLLRWPGGCYADHYHWRDGIGPQAQRPRRLGMSCGLQVEDDNSLGTHEFLWLCRQLRAEPYLAGNVGSGTPQELCDWLEYCNSGLNTTLARERAANGDPQPFGVRLWGVGNENWGCGGNYDAVTYALEYRRYATMLRHVDPAAELVACGFDDDWNAKLLGALGKQLKLVDHLSIHCYWWLGGPETNFSDDEYYRLLDEAAATEDFVQRTAAVIDEATGGRQRIGIALDEWGVWHPESRASGPLARSPVTYEQANTLRDALAAAVALEGFHRQCHVLSLANLAQIVNVLQAVVMTDGPDMWLTPTYHVLRLHTPHLDATALPVEIDGGSTLPGGSPAVSATASRSAKGMAVTLINRHLHKPASVRLQGIQGQSKASGQLLSADSPQAVNSLEHRTRVSPVALEVHADAQSGWRVELPPCAVATVVFRAA